MQEYPDFVESCGYGHPTGILGPNCRHIFRGFVEGVSERTYTDEQLEAMRAENNKFTYEGKEYDSYSGEQEQRKIERTIRKYERLSIGYKATGQEQEEVATAVKLKSLRRKYREFSAAAGLPEQWDRTAVIMS